MLKFETGDVIGDRYRIKGKIGKGGMGMVYMVRDLTTGERCALKTLLPQYVKEKKIVERFIREVNAQRLMKHPGIVKIFGARQIENTLFYVMEYLDGVSVRVMLRRGKIDFKISIRILYLLCEALEHAHEHTVHRDLSPDNVMVVRDGTVKLLDFGLAKLTENDSNLTRTGVFIGKVHYSAPEQGADAKSVDLRADIYSLGVMFHEMLSGELPYANKTLTDLVPELPKECDDFVEKARALDPEDRFQNAKEFRHELVRIYGIHTGETVPDLDVYDDEIPQFVQDAAETVDLLREFLVAPVKSSDPSSKVTEVSQPNTPTVLRKPKETVEQTTMAPAMKQGDPETAKAADSGAVAGLKGDIEAQEAHYTQLQEGMKLLAAQMQEFVDEQSKAGAEMASDRSQLGRMKGDLDRDRKAMGELSEQVSTQRDSMRTYTVQMQLLESGLATAQADLESQRDYIKRLQADSKRDSAALKEVANREVSPPSNQSASSSGIPIKAAIAGFAIAGAIGGAVALLFG